MIAAPRSSWPSSVATTGAPKYPVLAMIAAMTTIAAERGARRSTRVAITQAASPVRASAT